MPQEERPTVYAEDRLGHVTCFVLPLGIVYLNGAYLQRRKCDLDTDVYDQQIRSQEAGSRGHRRTVIGFTPSLAAGSVPGVS